MKQLTKRLAMLNKNSLDILFNQTGLPELHRKALNLKYIDELTAKEITKTSDFNTYDVETMQGILGRARRDLNRLIDTQYELYDKEVMKIIDIMSEFDIK